MQKKVERFNVKVMAATVLNDEINNMDLHKLDRITKEQYEFALNRIEDLLPLVTDDTPANDRNARSEERR